jgi:hypothetical protein
MEPPELILLLNNPSWQSQALVAEEKTQATTLQKKRHSWLLSFTIEVLSQPWTIFFQLNNIKAVTKKDYTIKPCTG